MSNRLVFDVSNAKKRWVVYFDLLGFRDFVKDGHIVNTFFHWEKCLNTFHNNLHKYPELDYAHFSDTFLIYAPDDSKSSYAKIDSCSRWFFQHAILQQIPLRGALGWGEFYADKANSVFLGKALVTAYEFGEQFNWIGYMLSPSSLSRIQHSDLNLPSCPVHFRKTNVPTKLGSEDCVALLCGGGKGRNYIRPLEEMKRLSLVDMKRKQKPPIKSEELRKNTTTPSNLSGDLKLQFEKVMFPPICSPCKKKPRRFGKSPGPKRQSSAAFLPQPG